MRAFRQLVEACLGSTSGARTAVLLLLILGFAGCQSGGGNSNPPPDTTAPTVPAGFTATAASNTQINLAWTASTDNVGVTGYKVERCQVAGCSNFTQIATPSGMSFNDTGLTASTTYSYRVRATDAANNLSGFSGTSTTTTQVSAIAVSISPKRAAVTTSQFQQFAATVTGSSNTNVNWIVDGIPGGNGTVGTINASGVYAPGTQVGVQTVKATSQVDGTASPDSSVAVTDLAGVFTHHNDNARTGQNLKEFALTPSTLNPTTFGKLFSCLVDGFVYAEPLYVANLTIGGGKHNVVIVATEHDSVYALDADSASCTQFWKTSFLSPGVTTVPAADTLEMNDLVPEIGITSTPVIDVVTQTLYVVPKTKETVGSGCSSGSPCYVHRLHALNLLTGAEKAGSPMVISAPNFDQLIHMQRPALLLNNNLYVAFGSHGDQNFNLYHGWLMAYDKTTLAQQFVWMATDNGSTQGAIWQSGAGPAADAGGNIYVETANGAFDGGPNYGDSIVKLTGAGSVLDFFSPFNQDVLRANDVDLGSAGVVVLPDSVGSTTYPHLALGSGKSGFLYLLDQNNLGRFNSSADQVLQKIAVNPNSTQILAGIFGQPAYWNGNIYAVAIGDVLKQFTISNATISTLPVAQTTHTFTRRGAVPVVSANGTSGGIVWALDISGFTTASPVVLYALDAGNVSNVLYTSSSSGAGAAGPAVKFTVPTVANGKVYIGTQTELSVFGLLPN